MITKKILDPLFLDAVYEISIKDEHHYYQVNPGKNIWVGYHEFLAFNNNIGKVQLIHLENIREIMIDGTMIYEKDFLKNKISLKLKSQIGVK